MPDLTSSDLAAFSEKGPASSRLENAESALRIYNNLKDADDLSAQNRRKIQAMLDGEAPYSRAAMAKAGAAHRYNLNFGEGNAIVSAAQSSYADLVDSVEVLGRVHLPAQAFDPAERSDYEDVISEELHQMIRYDWSDFDKNWDILSTQFISHGLGLAYHPYAEDWKWRTGGWDDFLLPRDTEASEDSVEVLIAKRSYLPHELYKKIEDEKVAKQTGWDVEAVKIELVNATKNTTRRSLDQTDWAELQRRLKNNDLEVSYGGSSRVEVLHFWVREFSGKYSHYMVPREASKAAKFLYTKRDAFDNANQAFTIFTDGVGNGTYHSIRGLGYRIFPAVQVMNRLRCSTLDHAMLSSSILLQPKDSADLDQAPLTLSGSVGMLGADYDVVQTGIQDRSEPLLNLGREMSILIQNNTGAYRSRGVSAGVEQTRYEVMARQEQESRLSTSQINLFYRSWRKLLSEAFRRVQNIDPLDARFPEVSEFYARCLTRGVPPEVVKMAVGITPERAVGLGSPSARQLAFAELTEMAGSFDEIGRESLIRDRIASRMGRAAADRYKPRQVVRPVIDEKVAELENAAMHGGNEVEVMPGENHAVHAKEHLEEMMKSLQALEALRNEGVEPKLEDLIPHVQFLAAALQHTGPHVEALAGDMLRQQDYGSMRQALQQIEAAWFTYMRQMKRISEREQPTGSMPADPAAEERQMKLRALWEQHQLKMQVTAEKAMQQMEIRRLQADQRLSAAIRSDTQKRLAGFMQPASAPGTPA